MNTFPLGAYETLEGLRVYEKYASQHTEFPLTESEFWSIFQRGLEIRMGLK